MSSTSSVSEPTPSDALEELKGLALELAAPEPAPPAAEAAKPAAEEPRKAETPKSERGRSKAAGKPALRGFLDSVIAGRVEGWAFNPAKPAERVEVEVWADGEFVAKAEADKYREDLHKAGIGDGCARFSILLPPRLYDGVEREYSVRVAGLAPPLGESKRVTLPRERLRVQVEELDGSTLRGEIVSEVESWRTIEVFMDNERFATLYIPPLHREPLAQGLPLSALDGHVHWFQFKTEDGKLVGEFAAVTPHISTPENALQRYAREFPGHLSANAARRYAALGRQLTLAASLVAKQAPGPDRLTLPAYLEQVAVAHAQVHYGVADRPGKPAPLTFPQYEKPKVSIVIPAHNKFWVTYNCLAALILAPNVATCEIILVDDGSSDRTREIETLVKGITVVRHESGQGFIRASNDGGEQARGEYVVMLNNDTEPRAGWVDELIYVFEHFDEVGMVGAKLVYPDGKLQEAGGLIFPNLDVWNYGRNKNPHDPRYNYVRQIDYCSGACLMLRNEVWRQLRGFDDFYAPAYFEDTDLAFRVRAMGLKTYYTPFAEIVHFEGVSSGTSTSGGGAKRYQAINQPKFRSRWGATIRRFPPTMAPDLAKDRGVALRALVIDAQPPQPDRDAGSYAAIQEMRLLQRLGVKLTFVPENMAYLGNYTEDLQRMGVECLYAPFQVSIESIIEERGGEFDFIYITRYSVAKRYLDVIRRAAPQAKIVFCNADLHFLREVRAAIAARSPELMQKAVATREEELDVVRRVDVTLSYTDTEAAVIASHLLDSANVMKCPWVVETSPRTPPFKGRKGVAFLGSFNHPPNEEAVLFFIHQVMPELRLALPGVKFNIYGSAMPDRVRALAGEDVIPEGYAEDVADVYDACRVFVAPLVSGAGIKGKVIGALAAGVPCVISPLAAEGVGVSAGAEAIVAETVGAWVRGIVALHENEARWSEMSARARAFIENNYSAELGLTRMRAALAAAGIYTD